MTPPRRWALAWVTAVLSVVGVACSDPPPSQETLNHHIEVDLSQAWSKAPWAPSRDATGRAQRNPERVELEAAFTLPSAWVGHGSALLIDGLSWRADVSVNGRDLGSSFGGPGTRVVSLGDSLRTGENLIRVVVDGRGEASALIAGTKETSAVVRTAPRLLLRPKGGLINATARLTPSGVQLVAHTAVAHPGASVRFEAWRDGVRVADWGEAPLEGNEARLVAGAWSGPLWPEPGALFFLRATLYGADQQQVDAAAWRTALRRFELTDGSTMLNGQPHRLLGLRKHNAGFTVGLEALSSAGLNLVEFHGEIPTRADLAAADELGVALAVLPRCDGRIQATRDAVLEAATELSRQDADILAPLSHAPSVLLWSTEGSAINRAGFSVGRPLIANMRTDPMERLVTAWDLPAFAMPSTGPDERFLEERERAEVAPNSPFWVLEFHLEEGQADVTTLAAAVQQSIDAGAVGGVLPGAIDQGGRWADAWSSTARNLGVQPLEMHGRRSASRVSFSGVKPGTMTRIDVPGGPVLAAVAGPGGRADIEVWHSGEATATTPLRTQTVSLRPGRWLNRRWAGDAIQVDASP